jgi:glycosyltransferase involved in cell wall biosynthesis
MSRIVYLSNARLPTEKANGYQVMKMCEGMAALGHEVELLHPWRRQPDPALAGTDPFSYYGVPRTFAVSTVANLDVVALERWLPEPSVRAMVAAQQMGWGLVAARQAAQRRPDLVYTREPALAYWASQLAPACVYEAHVPPSSRRAPLIRSFARRPSTRSVFATTRFIAADLVAAGVPEHKVEVLPNGADVAAFADAPDRDDARNQLGLPPARAIVGYVGRFETMGRAKGLETLIRAVSEPAVRELDPLLLCVGGPMDRVPAYLELARSLGLPPSALQFVDRVPNADVPRWLRALDLAAMPYPAAEHYATGMSPMKMFEYMAAGLPIVATDLPAVREVLDHGANALLVQPGEPPALARAFVQLLENPGQARALGARAARDALSHTWEHRAQQALAITMRPTAQLERAPVAG